MPQVQVLPYVPSFGESMLPKLAEAGNAVAKAVQKRSALAALEQYFPKQQANAQPGGTQPQIPGAASSPMASMPQPQGLPNPIQAAQLYSLGVDAYGEEGAKQMVQAYAQQQKHDQDIADQIAKEERDRAFKREERAAEAKEKEQKQRRELVQQKQKVARFNTDIEKLEKLKPATGVTFYKGGRLNRQLQEDRADIDARGAGIADYLYNVALENKGALSEVKIRELVEPYKISSKDSERTYQGKLNYIKDVVKNMETGLTAEEAFLNTPSELKPITEEIVGKFLDQAGNDIAKAKELASQAGYIF